MELLCMASPINDVTQQQRKQEKEGVNISALSMDICVCLNVYMHLCAHCMKTTFTCMQIASECTNLPGFHW